MLLPTGKVKGRFRIRKKDYAAPWRVEELLEGLRDGLEAGEIETVHDGLEQPQPWQGWLLLDRFDRRAVNRRLRQYAQGDQGWMDS